MIRATFYVCKATGRGAQRSRMVEESFHTAVWKVFLWGAVKAWVGISVSSLGNKGEPAIMAWGLPPIKFRRGP